MKPSLLLLAAALVAGSASAADEPGLIGPEGCQVVNPHPDDGERISWNGPCKDGLAEGKGILIWYQHRQETSRYEGDFVRGKPHGNIYRTDRHGDQYEGGFVAGKREGKGIWASNDGSRYEGDFKANRFDGQGSIVYAEGGRYTGQWKNGKFHGKGKAVYIGGQVVEGEFVDGLPVGASRVAAAETETSFLVKDARSSRVQAPAALTSVIPFDKPYPAMTVAEQETVRSQYGMLHERDEPPFPLNGMARVASKLHELARLNVPTGSVVLRLRISAEGKPMSYIVVASPSPEMADAITQILMGEKFKPGLCNGVPCSMLYKFAYTLE